MNEADYKTVGQFKQALLEHGVSIHELRVYGSRARGDAGLDSDLDILVVVEAIHSDTRNIVSECAWKVGFEKDIFIQTVLRSKADIETSPERSSLFMRSVFQEGIVV